MALLFADGFDGKKFATAGNNWITRLDYATPIFSTGRKGTGSSLKGFNASAQSFDHYFVLPAALTTVIVGFAWRRPAAAKSNIVMLYFGNTTYYVTNALYFDAGTGVVSLRNQYSFTQSSTITAQTAGGQIPTVGAWNYWEVKLTSSTTAGAVEIRKDGGVVLNATGLNTGVTSIDRVGIHMGLAGNTTEAPEGVDAEIDDLYVCDTTGTVNNNFLGDVEVLNRGPNNNGTNSGLLGSDGNSTDNYLLVTGGAPASVVAPDNSTYVISTAIGSKDTYNYYDIPTGVTVKGVVVNSFASKSDTANSTARNVVLHSGTTTTGADVALSTAWQETYTVLENVPGGTGWTPAQVNAAEFGWEHRTP